LTEYLLQQKLFRREYNEKIKHAIHIQYSVPVGY